MSEENDNVIRFIRPAYNDIGQKQRVMEQEVRRIFAMSYVGSLLLSDIVSSCWTCPGTVAYMEGADGLLAHSRKYVVSRAITYAFNDYVNGVTGVNNGE